jgi:hypothetical protein
VVLIESEDSTHAALPVRARNIYVAPFRQPLIENVRAADGAPAIISTSVLVIGGRRLRGDATQVMISGIDATAEIQSLTDSEIRLTQPADLRAGVQGLQVIQPRLMGTPPVAHVGVASNLVAFVLHPTINKRLDNSPDITVALPNVTVKLSPPVSQSQDVRLLLNEFNGARAYSFDSAPHNAETDPEVTDTLVFAVNGVEPGDYLARVQVNGAESPLELSADANDPVYVGPRVVFS